MSKTKVRFHLARGDNYQKWQISHNGEISYFDPATTVLRMTGCQLKNHRKTAEKIFAGENKTVCAWVKCDSVEVIQGSDKVVPEGWVRVGYNPKIAPHWVVDGVNVDGVKVEELVSDGRGLYANPAEVKVEQPLYCW